MIPVNLHHCNIFSGFEEKSSSALIRAYSAFIAMLNMFTLECNNCHRRGECIRHGYYKRGYLLTAEDILAGTRIRILRVRCKHCGRTHAILPEEIVPYLRFTATFIGAALNRYYTRIPREDCIRKESAEKICLDLAIEVPQLYRWKKQFEEQKDRYLGVLESARYSAGRAMEWLMERKDYVVEFAGKYLRSTEKIPMQSHANPTNMRQPVFS